MSIAAGADSASTDTSTLNSGGDARDAIETELAGLMKANAEREDSPADPEAKPETEEQKPDGDEPGEEKPEVEAKPEEKKPEADPKTARSLAAIAREKQRFEQQAAQARQQLQAKERELTEQRTKFDAELKTAQAFKARVSSDPVGAMLDALGDVAPEQLDYIARQFYSRFKAATDPKLGPEMKAQAERERATRAATSEVDKVRAELEQLKQERAAELKARQDEADLNEYVSKVEAAVGEETPLLGKAIKKNPRVTRSELAEVAKYIAKQTGRVPEPSEVAKGWETVRRSELRERLDLDVDALLKPPPKTTTPDAGEKQRPKTTINSELGSQTRPRVAPKTPEELDAEIERELEARMRGGG
jgi:hypothetical protein